MGKGNRRNSNKMRQRKSQARFKARMARRKAGEKPDYAKHRKQRSPEQEAAPAPAPESASDES
ncbi:MAG TPA: hypothetical protein ENK57_06075 [Polyangiaceae bacterium]|nr:hypothetical protein [Polyangiaceae bacterium]